MLTTILMLAGLAAVFEIMLHSTSKQYQCTACQTQTEKRGIIWHSCSNPNHLRNAGEGE